MYLANFFYEIYSLNFERSKFEFKGTKSFFGAIS